MEILSASFENFRNIEKQTLRFTSGINLIVGQNAQGKTNALEGIYLCAEGRSHRTTHEKQFVRFGEEFASVGVNYRDRQRENELQIRYSLNGRRVCSKNGVYIRRLSEFIGNFRAVLFTPEHLSIVKEGPAVRRAFLDAAISQLSPSYLSAIQRYDKILTERNRLIANAPDDMTSFRLTIGAWSEKLAEEAAFIAEKREEYACKLNAASRQFFTEMTNGGEVPDVLYLCRKSKEQYYEELMRSHEREIHYGATLFGTHKDDLTLMLNGSEARSFASQGQQRSIALALKLSEGQICGEVTGEQPVYLFDDVLSELDNKRRDYVSSRMRGLQVIITACDEITAPGAHRIVCENGVYRE